jgi:glycosyltransferase involved in cell wall biosynthesis
MNDIIFVSSSIKTGGGNRVFIELANQLVINHNVKIIFSNNSLETNTFYLNNNVETIKIGNYISNKIGKLINILKLFNYINNCFHEDIIIVSDPILSIFIFLIRKKEYIYRFIQADDYRIYDDKTVLKKAIYLYVYKFLCKRSFKDKIHFLFNSKYTYNIFKDIANRDDIACNIVHPALDHKIFYNKHFDIRKNVINICLVGRKHKMKGLQTFIDTYNYYLTNDIKKQINKIYIISHDDLSLYDVKQFEIIKPKSDQEISDIYNMSCIFISTSWWEGFGLPGLESMACGCALLTSDSGGCNEYAIDGKNSIYFKPKSSEELGASLSNLIRDKELRNEIIHNGKISCKLFTWKKSSLQLEKIIKKN